jgi:hypothetical protein
MAEVTTIIWFDFGSGPSTVVGSVLAPEAERTCDRGGNRELFEVSVVTATMVKLIGRSDGDNIGVRSTERKLERIKS